MCATWTFGTTIPPPRKHALLKKIRCLLHLSSDPTFATTGGLRFRTTPRTTNDRALDDFHSRLASFANKCHACQTDSGGWVFRTACHCHHLPSRRFLRCTGCTSLQDSALWLRLALCLHLHRHTQWLRRVQIPINGSVQRGLVCDISGSLHSRRNV